jgi:hypothetical protein
MATTTNYGWEIPDDTDLVKDGAASIRELGQDIDTTVFGLPSGALTLVKTQTIGSAVASVTVTGAFSATYDNYLINVSDTAFSLADDNVGVQMRTGSTTSTTGYYYVAPWTGYNTTPNYTAGSNQSTFKGLGRGLGTGEKQSFGFVLYSPFLASRTTVNGFGYVGEGLAGPGCGGYHDVATSYDQIVISCVDGGNFTGGTIRIYGYQNS